MVKFFDVVFIWFFGLGCFFPFWYMQIYIHIYIRSKLFFIFFSAFTAHKRTFRKNLFGAGYFEALIFGDYLNRANKTTLTSSPKIAPAIRIGHRLLRFFGC
jgi:hypothetical protein